MLKALWPKLGLLLQKALLLSFEKGLLYKSARNNIISLIPKTNRDVRYIKNWRPITLLNNDYKILAKALAVTVKPMLCKLIHPSQTGFISGRNISNNIRKVMDIINFVEQEKMDAILVTLDFEKTFDRVEHSALVGTLRLFNFGEQFMD